MQIVLIEDEHSYLIAPIGEEDASGPSFWFSIEATQKLWDAGWKPYKQPRVSKYLIRLLQAEGHIRRWVWPPCCVCGAV